MFRFRLQRVLELRERREQAAATELVQAQDVATTAREAREALESARGDLAGAPAIASSVGELQNLAFLLEQLDARVVDADSAVGEADETVVRLQESLRAAFRDRRALDLLRDRHHESWRAAETHQDRQAMDEIALTRFTQAAANRAANSTHDTQ